MDFLHLILKYVVYSVETFIINYVFNSIEPCIMNYVVNSEWMYNIKYIIYYQIYLQECIVAVLPDALSIYSRCHGTKF